MIRHWLLELTHKWLLNYLGSTGFILYGGGGKGDKPDTPDYAAAAVAQGKASLEAARATAKLNNPNIINPYGTQTVTYGGEPTFDAQGYDSAMKQYQTELEAYNKQPVSTNNNYNGSVMARAGFSGGSGIQQTPNARPTAPDKNAFFKKTGDPDVGTVTQKLSPSEQAIYDKGVETRTNVGNAGIAGSKYLEDVIGNKLSFDSAPNAPISSGQRREDVVNAMMGRVNEDTANSREQANSRLIAAGIRPGTKAYDDQMQVINRGYNDARQQAISAGGAEATRDFGMDTQARKDAIAEILSQRQTPLNEINALQSGSQVNNPFASNLGYQAGANVQPAPIFQGAQAQGQADLNAFNAQQAGSNGLLGGLFSLGAAGIGAYPWAGSDRRLKTNIKRIGTYLNGLAKYSFDYIWGEHAIGAMADEVEKLIPHAVMTHSSGYKMVNYAMVGD